MNISPNRISYPSYDPNALNLHRDFLKKERDFWTRQVQARNPVILGHAKFMQNKTQEAMANLARDKHSYEQIVTAIDAVRPLLSDGVGEGESPSIFNGKFTQITQQLAATIDNTSDRADLAKLNFAFGLINERNAFDRHAIKNFEIANKNDESITYALKLIQAYRREKRNEDALPIAQKAMQIASEKFGDESAEYITASIEFHFIQLAINGYDEKFVDHLIANFDSAEKALGVDHVLPIRIGFGLGKIFDRHRDGTRADSYLRNAVSSFRRVLGDDAPDTLSALTYFGNFLLKTGRAEEAIETYQALVDAVVGLVDPDHPATFVAKRGLQNALRIGGHHEQSLALAQEISAATNEVFGPLAGDSLEALYSVAAAQSALSQDDKAIETLNKLFARFDANDIPYNRIAFRARLMMAELQIKRDERDEAEESLRGNLASIKASLGEENKLYAVTLEKLSFLLFDNQHYEEAIAIQKQLLEVQTRNIDPDSAEVLRNRSNIAHTNSLLGNYQEAVDELEQLIQDYTRVDGRDTQGVVVSSITLAIALHKIGRIDDARDALNFAQTIARKLEPNGGELTQLVDDHMANLFAEA